MAYFAELDSNNIVLTIVTAGDDMVANYGGDQSVDAANRFAKECALSADGVRWMQTAQDGSFRKKYAGVGDKYDEAANVFYPSESYPSWTLDANFDWQPPVARPSTQINPINGLVVIFQWDEENQKWSGYSYNDSNVRVNFNWNPATSAWDQV